MKKFTIIYLSLIAFTMMMVVFGNEIGSVVGSSSFLLSLCIHYYMINRNVTGPFKKIMPAVFIISILKDFLLFCNCGNIGITVQILLGIIVNCLFINIFKIEKASLSFFSIQDLLKIWIPAVSIFLFFGFFILRNVIEQLFIPSIVHIMVLLPFITLALFRPFSDSKNQLVSLGAILKMVATFLYSIYFLVNTKPILIHLYLVVYPISQYLVINGLLLSHNEQYESKITNLYFDKY